MTSLEKTDVIEADGPENERFLVDHNNASKSTSSNSESSDPASPTLSTHGKPKGTAYINIPSFKYFAHKSSTCSFAFQLSVKNNLLSIRFFCVLTLFIKNFLCRKN